MRKPTREARKESQKVTGGRLALNPRGVLARAFPGVNPPRQGGFSHASRRFAPPCRRSRRSRHLLRRAAPSRALSARLRRQNARPRPAAPLSVASRPPDLAPQPAVAPREVCAPIRRPLILLETTQIIGCPRSGAGFHFNKPRPPPTAGGVLCVLAGAAARGCRKVGRASRTFARFAPPRFTFSPRSPRYFCRQPPGVYALVSSTIMRGSIYSAGKVFNTIYCGKPEYRKKYLNCLKKRLDKEGEK